MAKFLNTSAVTYHLEELIKNSNERLVLISPFLRFNDRIRELLEDRDRFKIDIRIVYGKNELQPEENNWLKSLAFVRTSFCKNLHAKCYLNESRAIITSMNLYEFSQVNNNEMGVLIERDSDSTLYQETYTEAQRVIRISEELKVTVERISREDENPSAEESSSSEPSPTPSAPDSGRKISTSQLAKANGIGGKALFQKFLERGWIERVDNSWKLTESGKKDGNGEIRNNPKFGEYIVWPEETVV